MIIKRKKLSDSTMNYIFINLADMLDSGINILTSMDIIESSIAGSYNKLVIRAIKEEVKGGNSISESFGKVESIPKLCKEMLGIGEDTGKLNEILILLANYYKKTEEIKKQIKGSLSYPVILLILTVVMMFSLFIFLVPSFVEMYSSLEIKPTGFTNAMFQAREFAKTHTFSFYLYITFYVIIIPAMVVRYLLKAILVKNFLRVKLVFQVKEYILLMILYLIFESGINVQRAFSKFSKDLKMPLLNGNLKKINQGLIKGYSLKEILEQQEVFSNYTLSMIGIGEEIGKLSKNLNRALSKTEENLINKTKKMVNLIQPVFIVIISSIIMVVILSFLMPLYQGINI